MVAGPAIGGLLFALSPELAYGAALRLFSVAMIGVLGVRPRLPLAAPARPPRSAPAVGAVFAGVLLLRGPLRTPAGPTLIAVVAAFGASMVVFGLSHWIVLSLAALAVSGAVDMVSMNIRTTTATLVTPDHVRGRVGSVEAVFVGASNELGAFESGTAAALLGAVPAVVADED